MTQVAPTSELPKLLVVGGPSSGKTTYRTQLYQRIEHQDGELQLAESVTNMAALENDVERLVRGLQPMHTNREVYHSTDFVIRTRNGAVFRLEFADYGGEQLQNIGESNSMPTQWLERAKGSSNWLLFLRIDQMRNLKSFMTDPVHSGPHPEANADAPSAERTAELVAIESVQRLLFVHGASLRHRLRAPRLAVFLSCWDELPKHEQIMSPMSLLQQRAPLFSQFISTNWQSLTYRVWGLSSTERKLSEDTPDLEFARRGADNIGYVVLDDGTTSPDLTIPIGWLMQTEQNHEN